MYTIWIHSFLWFVLKAQLPLITLHQVLRILHFEDHACWKCWLFLGIPGPRTLENRGYLYFTGFCFRPLDGSSFGIDLQQTAFRNYDFCAFRQFDSRWPSHLLVFHPKQHEWGIYLLYRNPEMMDCIDMDNVSGCHGVNKFFNGKGGVRMSDNDRNWTYGADYCGEAKTSLSRWLWCSLIVRFESRSVYLLNCTSTEQWPRALLSSRQMTRMMGTSNIMSVCKLWQKMSAGFFHLLS